MPGGVAAAVFLSSGQPPDFQSRVTGAHPNSTRPMAGPPLSRSYPGSSRSPEHHQSKSGVVTRPTDSS
jgi:hypothetical protein